MFATERSLGFRCLNNNFQVWCRHWLYRLHNTIKKV